MRDYLYRVATDKDAGLTAVLLEPFLLLCSFLYGALIRVLILFYSFRQEKLGIKVISIGNITLGGTGKTSLVELVSGYLRDKGHKIAILSRGYRRALKIRGQGATCLPAGRGERGQEMLDAEAMGDEPLMLQKNLGDIPVIVDRNRIKGAKKAIKEYAVDTVILDDGLQQWGIKKDLEIVTISATQGFANRHMLPRGILRQPLSSLKKADIFVLTKVDLRRDLDNIKNQLSKINASIPVIESVHQPQAFYDIHHSAKLLGLNYLRAKRVALFSGIADPDSFRELIAKLGIEIALELRFSDHHNYSETDLAGIRAKCENNKLGIIVTTEKDAARLSEGQLRQFKDFQVLVLRVELKIIKDEGKFFSRLLGLYPF